MRKFRVVTAIDHGLITEREAQRMYDLSPEELASWRSALSMHGLEGLRIARLDLRRRAQRAAGRQAVTAVARER